MTVTYSLDVANTKFYGFTKLLGRWKGSIYKILWKEFLVFTTVYALLSITYRFFLTDPQKRIFESVVIYFEAFIDFIPLSFVLGFYVSLVIGRWWGQYDAIPWPDKLCFMITTYVHGADERSRIIRRTLGRYLILMQALTFQSVGTAVKRRFPTTQHFVAAGFMTKEELTVYENLVAPYGKWWLPAQWFCALVMRARKEERIKDSILLNGMLEEFIKYRNTCARMFDYDWISVPLVYTQVVTLATYTYSVALVVGRQYLDPAMKYRNHSVDLYIPVFTLLQFFFYVGWLKVAEQIVNPYGEDDDDFELNWCLNRSCQVVYLLVDHFHTKHPKLRRDTFWDEMLPKLPQTKITSNYIINPQIGSAFNLEVNLADAEFLPMDTVMEDDNDAHTYRSDSEKQGNRTRNRSFLMNFLNSNFGQSIRKRSRHKSESYREAQGHINPAFDTSMEKVAPARASSPSQSGISSGGKPNSPLHSRTSTTSSHPISIGRQRRISTDGQSLGTSPVNSIIPECEGTGILAAIATTLAPVVANFEDSSNTSNNIVGSEVGSQRLDNFMPSIPEESSKVAARANSANGNSPRPPTKRNDVQALVAEASKVLEELNRAVASGGHNKECQLKGYESCCSVGTDSSDEETSADLEADEVISETVLVDIPSVAGDDTENRLDDLC